MLETRIRIGISGWRYPPWRGTFYPAGLAQREELAYASRRLPVIEINASFYALQRPSSYANWYAQTPLDFVFCVKAPRYVTHVRRLENVGGPIANFFASGIFHLREKLGPILWQFPADFSFDAQGFEEFLQLLPHDTRAASALAGKHERFRRDRSFIATDADRPVRHAVEIRNSSFLNARFLSLLQIHGVAAVITESAGRWPSIEDVTADFLYLRLHGDAALENGGYRDAALGRWARRIWAWHRGGAPGDARTILPGVSARSRRARDAYCFFDTAAIKLRAPRDAARLAARIADLQGAVASA